MSASIVHAYILNWRSASRLTLIDVLDGLRTFNPVLTAICLFFVVALFSFKLFSRQPPQPIDPREPSQAFISVFSPTSCAWPHDYERVVDYKYSTRVVKSKDRSPKIIRTISVSLSSILDRISNHEIELRNTEDLVALFLGELDVYGWRFELVFDGSVAYKVLRWTIGSYFSATESVEPRRNLKRAARASAPKETPNTLPPRTENTHINLNRTPFSRLDAALDQLRAALDKPGKFATLEFTTPVSEPEFPSNEFIMCALPFVSRCGRSTTTTPLFARFNHILEHLTRPGDGVLVLESATNISKEYADKLLASAKRLDEDRKMRSAFVDAHGMRKYWEERFMLAWEAALFSSGRHLARWKLVCGTMDDDVVHGLRTVMQAAGFRSPAANELVSKYVQEHILNHPNKLFHKRVPPLDIIAYAIYRSLVGDGAPHLDSIPDIIDMLATVEFYRRFTLRKTREALQLHAQLLEQSPGQTRLNEEREALLRAHGEEDAVLREIYLENIRHLCGFEIYHLWTSNPSRIADTALRLCQYFPELASQYSEYHEQGDAPPSFFYRDLSDAERATFVDTGVEVCQFMADTHKWVDTHAPEGALTAVIFQIPEFRATFPCPFNRKNIQQNVRYYVERVEKLVTDLHDIFPPPHLVSPTKNKGKARA
ncbi:hypothetical protein MKEN_01045500 [Mycena kentingensis (nom. inval.)]|nr:hypothetical protein MKEN_01045500 [Mycena kentingensis (nom. inval.)]